MRRPIPIAVCCNLLFVYVAYWACRLIFWAENHNALADFWKNNAFTDILAGAWMFDTSAIVYTNLLYVLLMLLPWHVKETATWQQMCKWIFVVVNGIAIAMNLADAAYFPYTGRRTTASVFAEFSHEGNLSGIIGIELLRHWYLVFAAIALIFALWKVYRTAAPLSAHSSNSRYAFRRRRKRRRYPLLPYYLSQSICLLLFAGLAIGGMRGGWSHAVRPITISNANQYVTRPMEAAVVLNTPFSLIRTIGKQTFETPAYFATQAELETAYSPVHQPATVPTSTPKATSSATVPRASVSGSSLFSNKNIVVLIVESFGEEYIKGGYAPFTDSLRQQSLTWEYTFANGRKSIDAMPSILSSIPMFVEPFFLTPASLNDVGGLAHELKYEGYHSAFFHGAENGSMGFQAFARTTGFDEYFGRDEYNADKRFDGDADFDGMWAIWDEPFLQFYALQMSELEEPFVTAVFTASSHHPFKIPEAYRDTFPDEGIEIHKCVRYTDHALRRFFETAARQPWYEHTLFVLTADHTNTSDHAEYQTDLGLYSVPIFLFDPSGQLPCGIQPGVAQQIDIMPTLLGCLGYSRPYVAFGQDMLATPADSTWAVSYANGIYQFVRDGYLLQFDGTRTTALYDLRADWMLHQNLAGKQADRQADMERTLKAIIQQYMRRMNQNQLVITDE